MPPANSSWTRPDTTSRPIAVLGSGVMGRRIAMMWVASGHRVSICEQVGAKYDDALNYIKENQDKQAAKMGTKPGTVDVTPVLEVAAKDAWMVIEAVPERLDLKIDVLAHIDKLTPPNYVITTNSSSLRSSQMISKTKNNYRICNGHYYMPPEQNYYEIMSCGETDPLIFPFLMEMAASAGFIPIHAKADSTGLVFNRVWAAIKRETLLVMADGVSDARTIDSIFKGWFNATKGPCEMMDVVGLDTVKDIEDVYVKERKLDPRARDWLQKNFVDQNKLGAKTGKGLLE